MFDKIISIIGKKRDIKAFLGKLYNEANNITDLQQLIEKEYPLALPSHLPQVKIGNFPSFLKRGYGKVAVNQFGFYCHLIMDNNKASVGAILKESEAIIVISPHDDKHIKQCYPHKLIFNFNLREDYILQSLEQIGHHLLLSDKLRNKKISDEYAALPLMANEGNNAVRKLEPREKKNLLNKLSLFSQTNVKDKQIDTQQLDQDNDLVFSSIPNSGL